MNSSVISVRIVVVEFLLLLLGPMIIVLLGHKDRQILKSRLDE